MQLAMPSVLFAAQPLSLRSLRCSSLRIKKSTPLWDARPDAGSELAAILSSGVGVAQLEQPSSVQAVTSAGARALTSASSAETRSSRTFTRA